MSDNSEELETVGRNEIPIEKEEMRHYNFKPKAYNIKPKNMTKMNEFAQKKLEKTIKFQIKK